MEFIDRNEVLKILDDAIAKYGGWKHLGADKLLKEVRNEVESVKKDFFKKMRDEITKLQTYKMFPYEATVYVERDEVMRIFDKYTSGGEGNGDSD